MTLGKKQQKFSVAISTLILQISDLGYDVRVGDFYATTGHKKNSNHYIKLAGDINLFYKGKYITDGTDPIWAKLHDMWEKLGGGKRILRDMNHFSFEHNGRR